MDKYIFTIIFLDEAMALHSAKTFDHTMFYWILHCHFQPVNWLSFQVSIFDNKTCVSILLHR